MKYLELGLNKIALMGGQKEEENLDLRIFLKGQETEKVDEIVHQLDIEIKSQIDCQKCGNCCKSLLPGVTNEEIENLSRIVECTKSNFEDYFVETNIDENVKYLKDTPCKFLKDKSCTIYEDRPADCRSYPHTHKPNFTSRTFVMIDNYSICPIVFNLFEGLKTALGYRYFRGRNY